MIIADLKKDKIYLTGKLTTELKNTLKSVGFATSPKGDLYATYDVYLKNKEIIVNLWESKVLRDFISKVNLEVNKDFSEYFKTTPYDLYDFQKEFVYWFNNPLISRRASLNSCECGLGKSAMALAALFATGNDKPLIIICPKNAIGVWKEHLKLFKYPFPIYDKFTLGNCCSVITYEGIPPLINEASNKDPLENYFKDIPKNINIIADEFHLCKNDKTKRTKRFKSLFKMMVKKEGKCIALTASPILNRESELKTLLSNLDLFKVSFGTALTFNNLFGGSYHPRFRYLVWDSSKRKPEEIKDVIKDIIFIRKKKDVIKQLPIKIETNIVIDLEKKKYTKELDNLDKKYKDKTELLKEISQVDFSSYMLLRQALSLEKFKQSLETIELYEEINKPIVVFSDFKEPINQLGLRKGWKCITGDTSSKLRTEYAEEFNKGNLKGLAVTIGAGSTALSLTGTDTILFIDLSVIPGNNYQARNRIDRISKLNETLNYIYFISNHSFEKRLQQLILEKELLISDTL